MATHLWDRTDGRIASSTLPPAGRHPTHIQHWSLSGNGRVWALSERAWRDLEYDLQKYPFDQIVRTHLGVERLEDLHRHHVVPRLTTENEQSTELHRLMYTIGQDFYDVYTRFVAEWVQPLFGAEVVFQERPNFRFQTPGNVAVARWHRDSDAGHHRRETNIWVPLTAVNECNCVWLESRSGSEEFQPAVVSVGSALIFNACELKHGNVRNTSGQTRVSFEFRVILAAEYQDSEKVSVNLGRRFALGEYFRRLP
ncbi:hypothetical protein F5X71_19670 [Nocardia brasiliensis]|uniref:2OG-Fe(II) oxygenase n=1 Tax=Nocardia brasiliensis TaxID=37326 RepID=A0A6G9XTN2_NOCBR|nr:hypothetical protein F5X71_19670 [Nocardia brasiliensis]